MRTVWLTLATSACWPYISGPYTELQTNNISGDRIEDVRIGVLEPGSLVTVQDVDVIGVWDLGFAVQDPRGGDQNAGLAVFLDAPPGVEIGDHVDLNGEIQDYFGELQLVMDSAPTNVGDGLRVSPLPLTSVQASEDRYQSMLLQVSGPVTNTNYDCTLDGSGCTDTGLWEIGGASGVLVFDRMYRDSQWNANIGGTPVVGVTTHRWQRRRLMPRSDADFGE